MAPAAPLATTPRVLMPGFQALPLGVERYQVAGDGAAIFALSPGDRIQIIDFEGCQPAQLSAFAADGDPDLGLIGANGGGEATRLKSILAGDDGGRLRRALELKGARPEKAQATGLFAPDSPAGEKASFCATANVTVALAGGGETPSGDGTLPATDLVVFIERADPFSLPEEAPLPDPLGDPIDEFRIPAASARSYTVRAGEWIQIIDVRGQQCSDFQAFSARGLAEGREQCIDVTTTRTLMAHSYPLPGLHAKYYSEDMRPMVEVVQDSCIRHDAFGLACSSKYYDDIGYPGHINCTDNFNGALSRHQVAARRGWMAMNFFYNTGIDDGDRLFMDEPWSAPGDHVLLRALDDLVCVSSACPDDTSPANAWNPTDIHVRVYDSRSSFRRSIGFRRRADWECEMTKETGFHGRTSALTRDLRGVQRLLAALHLHQSRRH